MKRLLFSGAVMCATLGLAIAPTSAETPIPVMNQCPKATWTEGYNIWELIPLHESQYRPAVIIDGPAALRAGIGYDAAELLTLASGDRVTVAGEAWDMACNQWMYIRFEGNFYWVHNYHLSLL